MEKEGIQGRSRQMKREQGMSKPEMSKPETPKPETPKPETPKMETAKPETSKPETSKPETSKPETSKPETPKPETETLRMEVESRSENEEFARVAVAVFISRMNPTMEEIDDVKTAVSEAVTNGIIHGYQGKEGILYIEVAIQGEKLTVSVRDEGIGIPDIRKAMEPMYTSDVTGERSGMGFSFMEAFMDEVEVISKPGEGTQVIMKKEIGGAYHGRDHGPDR